MPSANYSKPGSLKDPEVAGLFVTDDPENRFTDLREIGHGSFGAVYFAMDEVTRECVAIKKMSYGGKQSGEKWQDIVREVKFLHQLRHRHVVDFKACYLKEQTCWLVMEYCVGSAADIIEVHKKPLREVEIAVICQEALHGLQYLHSLGRIHRDVKAGNILLTDQGVVKLADFGSASLVSPAQSFVGTPYWMAPEVILAMEHGRYNQRADIWSLGITCIELAEKRPPYFNMNAMSALYHIAQNDPPVLSSSEWSPQFQDFVTRCLVKDPAERMSTQECLSHVFIVKPKPPSILYDLIQRTKVLVRNLDHFQYRKLRKIMYLDEQQSSNSSEVSSLDSEDVDSIEDDLIGNDSPSSQSNSLSSMHSQRSTENLARKDREGHLLCESMKQGDHSGAVSSQSSSLKTSASVQADGQCASKSVVDVVAGDDAGSSGSKPKSQGVAKTKQEILALRRSRFATIKPTVAVVREQNEYATENNMREQMSGYKRMRREHLKEQKQLEEKSQAEMDTLRAKLDREYDQLLQQFKKELDRLHQTHRQELDKRVKTNDDWEKKLRKQILHQQDTEKRALHTQMKNECKVNMERLKQELKQSKSAKSVVENSLSARKQNQQQIIAEAEENMMKDHQAHLDFELRRFRRRRLLQSHQLEQNLLHEDLGVRYRQLKSAHNLLRRHHEQTQELETRLLQLAQNLRVQHLQQQHAIELQNQQEYTKRLQDELRKRHGLQAKQQPKELKQKETQIRKQFRQAVKTQTRQYKLLQSQLTQQLSKEEQRDVLARLKEEQKRKLALLAEQYENSIGDMMEKQTVKLETWQEEEARQMKNTLSQELELLMAFQSKQRIQMEQQNERERLHLEEKVSLRCAALEQKIEEEETRFQNERQERIKQLQNRQKQDFESFDEESVRMGFSLVALSSPLTAAQADASDSEDHVSPNNSLS